MAARRLDAEAIGVPFFAAAPDAEDEPPATAFDLSSHRRAREALEDGLAIEGVGFNIFVIGEDRSGRMTATLDHLGPYAARLPTAHDWVYLNNFARPLKPKPARLPPGVGRNLRDRLAVMARELRAAVNGALNAAPLLDEIRHRRDRLQSDFAADLADIRQAAQALGLDVQREAAGALRVVRANGQALNLEDAAPDERERLAEACETVGEALAGLSRTADRKETSFADECSELRRLAAEGAADPILTVIDREFHLYSSIAQWLRDLRADVFDRIAELRRVPDGGPFDPFPDGDQRYAVNLLVDRSDDATAPILLEPNPTVENLFGWIEYGAANGVLETNFTMIRAGALHRANGGVLVLRAEAIARQPMGWDLLKGALRDRVVRIEEMHRIGTMPMLETPRPKPVALDIKVVIVGAPRWYYTFFSSDPEFKTYFKIRAEIDADMDASSQNLETYSRLIRQSARRQGDRRCDDSAVTALLGQSARWAGNRNKLSARFELIDDVLAETASRMADSPHRPTTAADIRGVLKQRRRRSALLEDRSQESIRIGHIMIDCEGAAIGQINALTVRDIGDHVFGAPVRVTARISVGEHGVTNIERNTELGGPIQHKGVLVLEGFLKGRFARHFPLSFAGSVTFEQNYAGVEGDSASLGELCALLSALTDVPLRQDLAVTGSVNQHGRTQVIGEVSRKIEGFYRTCRDQGLSGTQGVVIPAANATNLTLLDDVVEAVGAGKFHIYAVASVDEAIELFTGLPAGAADADGRYPPGTINGLALARLAAHDRLLSERYKPRG